MDRLTYFLSDDIVMADRDVGMSKWRSWLYVLMARNARHEHRYFNLPPAQVFEIGTQIQV